MPGLHELHPFGELAAFVVRGRGAGFDSNHVADGEIVLLADKCVDAAAVFLKENALGVGCHDGNAFEIGECDAVFCFQDICNCEFVSFYGFVIVAGAGDC